MRKKQQHDSILTPNAELVLSRRYYLRDAKGRIIEDWPKLTERVAKFIASRETDKEKWTNIFQKMMYNLEFLPNSPTLMNAGTELKNLSACYVMGIEDSTESIGNTNKDAMLVWKSGGGTGFDFSRLRQSGANVGDTSGVASGPCSFIRIFNTSAEEMKQGGRRRGANMGILRVDHPDILKFIRLKAELRKVGRSLSYFNLSVGITDKFLQALRYNKYYDLKDPRDGSVVGRLKSSDVWKQIAEYAWAEGCPGVVFLDTINRKNTCKHLDPIRAVNPCGEQPLRDWESCNLGSINLTKFIKGYGSKPSWDWGKLAKTIEYAVRFLDNVIDVNGYPLKRIDVESKRTRKIGLGVMGWADALAMLGIPYASNEAIREAEKVMGFLHNEGIKASCALAQERGVFPAWDGSEWQKRDIKIRNATITTVAPTGTISTIAGCWFGIEPYSGLVVHKEVLPEDNTPMAKTTTLEIINQYFLDAIKHLKISQKDMDKIVETGSCQEIKSIPARIKKVFKTAHEIEPKWHVKMIEAFQEFSDSGVSKTVNLPHDATPDDVRKVFSMAAKGRIIKGITIFRDGCLPTQVVYVGGKTKQTVKELKRGEILPVPDESQSWKKKVKTGCGHMTVFVNYTPENGIEDFYVANGGGGGCPSIQGVSRMASIAWRAGVSIEAIVDQCSSVNCPASIKNTKKKFKSCPDALGKILTEFCTKFPQFCKSSRQTIKVEHEEKIDDNEQQHDKGIICPSCGAKLLQAEGCITCPTCGWSKC